ncbi:hypothetical protein [Kiloniella sp.]|uniref:hypothetical protein n=1 Tax=Kiloniella sp. TaxID=1938587 RepID=UPI003A911FAA
MSANNLIKYDLSIDSPLQNNMADGPLKFIIPYQEFGIKKYLHAAFSSALIVGATILALITLLEFLSTNASPIFLIFFCLILIGKLYLILLFLRVMSPSTPEELILGPSYLIFDTGLPPFDLDELSRIKQTQMLFQKRQKHTFSLDDITTLTLRNTENGNRLTIDQNGNRINLATAANEQEKKWLYNYLKDTYPINN